MSCDPNDYTSAAMILQSLMDERREAGENVESGQQWLARIQDRGRQVHGELMRRNAIRDELANLLTDLDMHDRSDAQKAEILLGRYEMTPREGECPF